MGKKKPKSKATKGPGSVESNNTLGRNSPLDPKTDANAAPNISATSVFLKVCRLCESKDGPFLNIFDTEKVTSKKVEELMPFGISENDDLPHKICFRCSAKVEELYEFIQKCIKTQNNLHTSLGKKPPIIGKQRTLWEQKLNKSNMSNDDICDALIKKAMEGIKDIPMSPLTTTEEKKVSIPKKDNKPASPAINVKKEKPIKPEPKKKTIKEEDELDMPLKDSNIVDDSKFIPIRTSRSQNKSDNLLDGLPDVKRKKTNKPNQTSTTTSPPQESTPSNDNKKINELSFDYDCDVPVKAKKPTNDPVITKKEKVEIEKPEKPFNIMEHVSMIKVNGVGVLFQCKLCNRNFMKIEIVMNHGCAKNGAPKADFTKNLVPPEPPKIPVVKYINTKVDNDLKKPSLEKKSDNMKCEEVTKVPPQVPEIKPKPRIGPASKVRRQIEDHQSVIGMTVVPIDTSKEVAAPAPTVAPAAPVVNTPAPSVNFSGVPLLHSRYKLIPGPNNTFQLVEEGSSSANQEANSKVENKSGKKRKGDEDKSQEVKIRKQSNGSKSRKSPEIIDLEEVGPQSNVANQPYPVGLFQTMPHNAADVPFTTPAMKKQSYTVVQTDNPSKLRISAKPQHVVEDVSKKKAKKSKVQSKPEEGQPFSVTLEDTAPPKDAGFFTFINVDPLLQPSYVLPTDNIIQESQISTSTPIAKGGVESKDSYSCNMCGEKFTREKKLLSHIQSHYSKMDEEDQLRAEKVTHTRKRSGKRH